MWIGNCHCSGEQQRRCKVNLHFELAIVFRISIKTFLLNSETYPSDTEILGKICANFEFSTRDSLVFPQNRLISVNRVHFRVCRFKSTFVKTDLSLVE